MNFAWVLRCWAIASLLFCGRALADAPRVVLLLPKQAQPALATQIRAELTAAGFVVVLDTRVTVTAMAPEVLEATARRTQSFAAIAVVQRQDASAVDIWVADRVTGKTVLRRIDASGEAESSGIVALRAVELLRASLLELNLPVPGEGSAQATETIREFADPAAAPKRFGVALGALGWVAPGQMPAMVSPRLVLSWRPVRMWAGEVDIAAPASATVSHPSGSAHIGQQLLLAKLRFEPLDGPLQPFLSGGGGALRMTARGVARAPYEDRTASAVSFAAAIGAGARWAVADHVALVADVGAVLLFPEPVVGLAGKDVARSGRPLVVSGLMVEVAW